MDRPGYPSTRTLDDVINALPAGTHRAFLEREASLVIDGALLRHRPYLQYSADPREHRGARSFLEILTLARGLAFLGYENAVANRAMHPDFEVSLPDGRPVGIEVTDAFATGTYEGRLQSLRLTLLNAIDASQSPLDGRLVTLSAKRVWDSGVAVNLGIAPNVPVDAVPFTQRDVTAFVHEFLTWLAAGEHRYDRSGGDAFSDPSYAEMTRWEVIITSSELTDREHPGAVEFMLPSVGQSVDQIKATVLDALTRKQAKAVRYGSSRPLWLFIEIADRVGLRAFRAFENFVRDGFPAIAPYELVVVNYEDVAIVADGAGNVSRTDTVLGRGTTAPSL